ncbi:hypothetical protein [Lacrimispora xylanisolvens]|uniref:hypothetical protein n=1 Tax=Lacrimispora xylanisolvens TaxID=384636 RepID=UPI00240295CE
MILIAFLQQSFKFICFLFIALAGVYAGYRFKNKDEILKKKEEKRYEKLFEQFADNGDKQEYDRIKRTLLNSFKGTKTEIRTELIKKIYLMNLRKEREDNNITVVTGIVLPMTLLYVSSDKLFPIVPQKTVTTFGLIFAVFYIAYIMKRIPVRMYYCRLILVLNDILQELDDVKNH